MLIAFKPMKGCWRNVNHGGIENIEGKVHIKFDKSPPNEQIELSMHEVEAFEIVRDIIKVLPRGSKLFTNLKKQLNTKEADG